MSIPLQACLSCGQRHYPALLLCGRCGGARFATVEAEAGEIVATTTLRHRMGGAMAAPVMLATVRVADGPLVVARLERPAEPGSSVSLRLGGRTLWAG